MVRLILVIFLICPLAKADSSKEAIRKASEALYIQSGMDKVVKQLDKKYTPKVVKKYGGWLIAIQDSVVNEQIRYKWEFTF
jgi:hypothetical protein